MKLSEKTKINIQASIFLVFAFSFSFVVIAVTYTIFPDMLRGDVELASIEINYLEGRVNETVTVQVELFFADAVMPVMISNTREGNYSIYTDSCDLVCENDLQFIRNITMTADDEYHLMVRVEIGRSIFIGYNNTGIAEIIFKHGGYND